MYGKTRERYGPPPERRSHPDNRKGQTQGQGPRVVSTNGPGYTPKHLRGKRGGVKNKRKGFANASGQKDAGAGTNKRD